MTRYPCPRSPRAKPWTRWQEAPNALTPAQQAAALAAHTKAGPASTEALRTYRVGVVQTHLGLRAYTTDRVLAYVPEESICRHGVTATSGDAAKTLALDEHRTRCERKRG